MEIANNYQSRLISKLSVMVIVNKQDHKPIKTKCNVANCFSFAMFWWSWIILWPSPFTQCICTTHLSLKQCYICAFHIDNFYWSLGNLQVCEILSTVSSTAIIFFQIIDTWNDMHILYCQRSSVHVGHALVSRMHDQLRKDSDIKLQVITKGELH